MFCCVVGCCWYVCWVCWQGGINVAESLAINEVFLKLILPSLHGPHLTNTMTYIYIYTTYIPYFVVLLWFAYSRTMALGYSKLSHVTGKNLFLIGNQRCGAWQVTFHFGSLRFIIPKQTSFFDVIEVLKTLFLVFSNNQLQLHFTPHKALLEHTSLSRKKNFVKQKVM